MPASLSVWSRRVLPPPPPHRLDPLLEKWSVSITDHFWPFSQKWVQPPPELEGVYELRTFVWTTRFLCVAFLFRMNLAHRRMSLHRELRSQDDRKLRAHCIAVWCEMKLTKWNLRNILRAPNHVALTSCFLQRRFGWRLSTPTL